MRKRVSYGVANYEELVSDKGYFVDKTSYIEKLEQIKNPVFLRPRRFGKSLWCRILECYYNIRQKDDFERLFGHTYIGKNPTPLRNSFFVLHLDFSTVDPSGTLEDIEESFDNTCNLRMKTLTGQNRKWFQNQPEITIKEKTSSNLKIILNHIQENGLPPLYVIIDEYDNFANQLIISHKDHLYYEMMAEKSFLKTFFKTLKEGRKTGAVANVFITGVLPITMDDLASGFNIATFITLDPEFENMLGFTQAETDALIDEIYQDYQIDLSGRKEVGDLIKNQYDGYHIISPEGEPLYNSTILMYFLDYFSRHRQIPEYLTDLNLKTDLLWVRRITGADPADTEEFVNRLTSDNKIGYDKNFLVSKFNMSQFFEKGFFPVSFFYLGMLTQQDDFYLKLPNLNMRTDFCRIFQRDPPD